MDINTWTALNFNEIPLSVAEIVARDEGNELYDFVNQPAPDPFDDLDAALAYAEAEGLDVDLDDCDDDDEKAEAVAGALADLEPSYPMRGTLFEIRGHISQADAEACGFLWIDAFGPFGPMLGVEGAGYNFYDAHFGPLRERLQSA